MANIQTLQLVERNCYISLQVKSKKPVAKDWLNNGKTFEDEGWQTSGTSCDQHMAQGIQSHQAPPCAQNAHPCARNFIRETTN